MEFTIEVHSWLGESMVDFLSDQDGINIESYVIDPDGTGRDLICGTTIGWSIPTLEEMIIGCDIPKSMFKIS